MKDKKPSQEVVSPELALLEDEFKREHAEVQRAMRQSLVHAVKAGEALIKIKKLIPYGDWVPWLSERGGVSVRMSQNYMLLAKNQPFLQKHLQKHLGAGGNETIAFLPIAGALRLIKFRDREKKKLRSEETFASILRDLRRDIKTGEEAHAEAHDETEQELEEWLELHREETRRLREVWESVSPETIRQFIIELVQEGLWPFTGTTEKMESEATVLDEEEHFRGIKARKTADLVKENKERINKLAEKIKKRVKKKGAKKVKRKVKGGVA